MRKSVVYFILLIYLFRHLFFDLGFTALSRIFHLCRADRSSKVGKNPGKNHLTIRKQNMDFPHVTQARLDPQRRETEWIKSQLSYSLGYGGPQIGGLWFQIKAGMKINISYLLKAQCFNNCVAI